MSFFKNPLLIVVAVTFCFLSSCTKEDIGIAQDSHSFEKRTTPRSGSEECNAIYETLRGFVPDTEEDIEFFSQLEDSKELTAEELQELAEVVGFEDIQALEQFFAEAVKSDCIYPVGMNLSARDCGDEMYFCIVDAVVTAAQFIDDSPLNVVFLMFLTNVRACAKAYLRCKLSELSSGN